MFRVETSRGLISRRTATVASIAMRIVIVLAVSLALLSSVSIWPGKDVNLLSSALAASDTTRPTVTIDQPSTGSTLSAGAIMVKGKASDNSGGSGINRVEVKVDSGPYKIATPAVVGDWSSWSVTVSVTAGERRLQARATDNAGNQAWKSAYVTVTTDTSPVDTTPPTVAASPLAGTYSSAQSVTLSANEPATIYYTINGDTPTTSSAVYTSPVSITSTTTLKFMAKDAAGNTSPISSEIYVIDEIVPTVTASPPGGTYGTPQFVSLAASEPATIHYTTDGTTPTTSSAVYSSPISIASNATLKYFGRDAAGNTGSEVTQPYIIDTSPPTVVASPLGDTYSSTQSVTLSASEPATVYYTTDGSTPTTSSAAYSSPTIISSTTTLSYFARDIAGNSGNVVSQVYTIETVDTNDPFIDITDPVANSEVIVVDGTLTVTGTASDGGSGVGIVELQLDSGPYSTATPKAPGDWSTWRVTVPITAGERSLAARATDSAGNQNWSSINITVLDGSAPPPPPDPDPAPEPASDDLPIPIRTINVASISEMVSNITSARPGDHIVLQNGIYSNGASIRVTADGTAQDPIVIRAESDGGAEISGTAGFNLDGASYVILKGFKFTYSQVTGKTVCDDCSHVRFTANTFALTTTSSAESNWLRITGTSSDNRVDHNTFQNKTTRGNFLLLYGEGLQVTQRNLVDHNYFYDHSYSSGNGGECIRVGYSGMGPSMGYNILEYNTLERCNGDAEAITVKSSGNIFRYNTFRNNQGSLVLRHGSDTLVDGNIFEGPNGIRAYGHNQKITNNYFANNPTSSVGIRDPIIIGRGTVADDLDYSNAGYSQAKNILIAHNTLVGNNINIVIGAFSGSYLPEGIIVANNIVTGSSREMIDVLAGTVTFSKNILYPTGSATVGDVPSSGYTNTDPQLVISGDIMSPSGTSPAIDALDSSETYGVTTDIHGEVRSGRSDIGADEVA